MYLPYVHMYISYVVRVLTQYCNKHFQIHINSLFIHCYWVDGHFFIHFHTHGVEIRGPGGNSGKKGMADASGDGD